MIKFENMRFKKEDIMFYEPTNKSIRVVMRNGMEIRLGDAFAKNAHNINDVTKKLDEMFNPVDIS